MFYGNSYPLVQSFLWLQCESAPMDHCCRPRLLYGTQTEVLWEILEELLWEMADTLVDEAFRYETLHSPHDLAGCRRKTSWIVAPYTISSVLRLAREGTHEPLKYIQILRST